MAMTRRIATTERVTLALRLADGTSLPIEASANAMLFIGRYSRISAFGPLGKRLKAVVVARH